MGSFLASNQTQSEEYKITDPSSAIVQVGYRAFLDAYQGAKDRGSLEKAIHDAIG